MGRNQHQSPQKKLNPPQKINLKQGREMNKKLDSASIDYTQLAFLLKAKEWQKADYETYLLVNQILISTGFLCNQTYLKPPPFPIQIERLDQFPDQEFHKIDHLWLKYSSDHFGFSIQKQIWLKSGYPTEVDWETGKLKGISSWKENNSIWFNRKCSAYVGRVYFLLSHWAIVF